MITRLDMDSVIDKWREFFYSSLNTYEQALSGVEAKVIALAFKIQAHL